MRTKITTDELLNYGTVNRSCNGFLSATVKGANEYQTESMKQAFMSGAFVLYQILVCVPDRVSDDIQIDILDNISKELEQWADNVERQAKDHKAKK